jgi:hypothetical protein
MELDSIHFTVENGSELVNQDDHGWGSSTVRRTVSGPEDNISHLSIVGQRRT